MSALNTSPSSGALLDRRVRKDVTAKESKTFRAPTFHEVAERVNLEFRLPPQRWAPAPHRLHPAKRCRLQAIADASPQRLSPTARQRGISSSSNSSIDKWMESSGAVEGHGDNAEAVTQGLSCEDQGDVNLPAVIPPPGQIWRRRLDKKSQAELAAVCLGRYVRQMEALEREAAGHSLSGLSTGKMSSTAGHGGPRESTGSHHPSDSHSTESAEHVSGGENAAASASPKERRRMTTALPDIEATNAARTSRVHWELPTSRRSIKCPSSPSNDSHRRGSSGSFLRENGSFMRENGSFMRENSFTAAMGTRASFFSGSLAGPALQEWNLLNTSEKWTRWCKETEVAAETRRRPPPWAVDTGLGQLRCQLEEQRSRDQRRMRTMMKLGVHRTQAGLRLTAPHLLPQTVNRDAVERYRHDEMEDVDRRSRRIRKALSEVAKHRHEAHRCIEVMQKTMDSSMAAQQLRMSVFPLRLRRDPVDEPDGEVEAA